MTKKRMVCPVPEPKSPWYKVGAVVSGVAGVIGLAQFAGFLSLPTGAALELPSVSPLTIVLVVSALAFGWFGFAKPYLEGRGG